MQWRGIICSSVTALGLCLSTAGMAQPMQGPAPETEEASQRASAADDIIVTARRRAEPLQETGLAASVLTAEELEARGVTDPRDLTALVPGLTVQPVDISTSFTFRGVGALAVNAFQENAIAYNVDDVVFGRPSSPAGSLFDIDRIEVLKGPQGTLYGRNATAGAINVVTRQPQLGKTSADMLAEIGNFSSRKLQGGLTLPLGDRAAVRVAGQHTRHDGYLSDGYDDEDISAGRLTLLLQPKDGFSLTISGDYSDVGGRGTGAVLIASPRTPDAPDPGQRIGGSDPRITQILQDRAFLQFRGAPPFASFTDDQIRNLVSVPLGDGFQDSRFWGVSAKARADVNFAELTAILAYRKSRPDLLTYNPGFPSRIEESSDQLTADIRLVSAPSDTLEYSAGLYLFDDSTRSFNNYNQGALANPEYQPNLRTESIAGYGSFTWHRGAKFRLIGGARFTHEDKSVSGTISNRTAFAPNSPDIPLIAERTDRRFTWNAGAEWDASDNSLIYASAATGFKSGGFFPSANNNLYAPETLTAFTFGAKNRLLGGRLTFNLEAFYWQYRDQQISYIGPVETTPGNFGQAGVTVNAGRSRIFGIEADMQWRPTENILLRADVQYLNSRYGSLTYDAISASGAPLLTPCGIADDPRTAQPPIRLFTVDCSGRPALNAPTWTANLGYRHTFPLGNTFNLELAANTRIESSSFINLDYLPEQKRGANTVSGASVALSHRAGRWRVTAFVDNIEDSPVINAGLTRPITNVSLFSLRRPRVYGLRLQAGF